MPSPSLRRAGATVIGVALLGKGFGFMREAVVAAVFGTTHAVDLYLAALVVPMVVATAITYTVPNAFVPLFTPASADKIRARAVAWGLLGAMTVLSLVICLFGRPMAALVASGFSESARAEVGSLVCLAAWVIPLSTVEALGRSHLLARKRFLGPGLAYLWQSAAIIAAAIVWSEHGAHALMWGLVVGTALAAGWNLVLILAGRAEAAVDAPGEPVQNQSSGIGRWVVAVLLVDAMGQLFTVMDRHFGSYLPSGSIAALQYANLVAFLPYSIVGVGLSTAIFPYLSDSVASGNDADVEAILDRAVRWSLFGVIPIVVWLMVFREQTVRILFERGAFDARSRELTATVLAAFSIGLVPNVLAAVGSRVFYVTRRWTPLFLGAMAGVTTKALCGWWWTRSAGIVGLVRAAGLGACNGSPVFRIFRPDPGTGNCQRGLCPPTPGSTAANSRGRRGAQRITPRHFGVEELRELKRMPVGAFAYEPADRYRADRPCVTRMADISPPPDAAGAGRSPAVACCLAVRQSPDHARCDHLETPAKILGTSGDISGWSIARSDTAAPLA
ncbi:MAG: oligosaccharide flippase family protein [candidate division Zixibacteria bacterium]|nr:oligosaccharide flippase family protein [candidate division Zixibacteria bacterium]